MVSLPKSAGPSKKSTRVTVPSESDALALSAKFTGTVRLAPFAGLVIATLGGMTPANSRSNCRSELVALT